MIIKNIWSTNFKNLIKNIKYFINNTSELNIGKYIKLFCYNLWIESEDVD